MKNKIIVILVAIIVLLVSVIAVPALKDVLADKDEYFLTYEKTITDTGETESEKTYQ